MHGETMRSSVNLVKTGLPRIPPTDVLVALALLAVAESQVWLGWHDGGDGVPTGGRPAEAIVLALPAIALAWRRRAPTVAAVGVAAATALQVAAVAPYAPFLPVLLPLLLANYANAAYGRARIRLAGLVAVGGGVASVVALVPEARTSSEAVFSAVVVAGSWLVGDVVRQRQQKVEIAEASREEWVRAAVADERVRIARELHDLVAHSVSLMGVQQAPRGFCSTTTPRKHGKRSPRSRRPRAIPSATSNGCWGSFERATRRTSSRSRRSRISQRSQTRPALPG
jgi:hypothetical protein